MSEEMRLIDAKALTRAVSSFTMCIHGLRCGKGFLLKLMSDYRSSIYRIIAESPTVDAVPREAYDDLREMFVDYVCGGTSNPAPYCANSCHECTDSHGWCRNGSGACRGFSPKTDGERRMTMTTTEKVALITKMIGDFWEYSDNEEISKGAAALIIAINAVVEFELPKEENDVT